MNDLLVVQDGQVVSMEYSLRVDDELLDSSDEEGPLEFLQGRSNIIPGLERELYGMKVGESKQVTVKPEDGYGTLNPQAFMDVPRAEFPSDIPLEEGLELHLSDKDGEDNVAYIQSFDDSAVRLDFNHPLAGAELHFDIKIVGLRPATAEELDHGHAHTHEHNHHE